MTFPPFVKARWRMRPWVLRPISGVCNLPIFLMKKVPLLPIITVDMCMDMHFMGPPLGFCCCFALAFPSSGGFIICLWFLLLKIVAATVAYV